MSQLSTCSGHDIVMHYTLSNAWQTHADIRCAALWPGAELTALPVPPAQRHLTASRLLPLQLWLAGC
jgi:hypothetical protein